MYSEHRLYDYDKLIGGVLGKTCSFPQVSEEVKERSEYSHQMALKLPDAPQQDAY